MAFNVDPNAGPGIKSCGRRDDRKVMRRSRRQPDLGSPAAMAANLATTLPAPVGYVAPKGLYANICMPTNPSAVVDPSFAAADAALRTPLQARDGPHLPSGTIVRQVYLNEKVDGVTPPRSACS